MRKAIYQMDLANGIELQMKRVTADQTAPWQKIYAPSCKFIPGLTLRIPFGGFCWMFLI